MGTLRALTMAVFNARWIAPTDPSYVAWGRARAARRRAKRVGPPARREMGEIIGGIVERAARHCLAQQAALQDGRILTWRETQTGARAATLYREVDAVQRINNGFKLFEIKLTTEGNMGMNYGLVQLRKSQKIIKDGMRGASRARCLLRLVYIAEVPLESSLPEVDSLDDSTPVGIIWITPNQIEASALDLGVELPADWMNPETRRRPEGLPTPVCLDSSGIEDWCGGPIGVAFRASKKERRT